MPASSTLRRLVAGTYAAIGVAAAVDPGRIPAVFGGTATTPESRTEVRVVYAGIPLAFAASLGASAGTHAERSVLRTIRDASAGMALARAAGSVVERRLRLWPTGAFLALEAALAVAAHRAVRTSGDPGHAT
jgi:hypothetical protein